MTINEPEQKHQFQTESIRKQQGQSWLGLQPGQQLGRGLERGLGCNFDSEQCAALNPALVSSNPQDICNERRSAESYPQFWPATSLPSMTGLFGIDPNDPMYMAYSSPLAENALNGTQNIDDLLHTQVCFPADYSKPPGFGYLTPLEHGFSLPEEFESADIKNLSFLRQRQASLSTTLTNLQLEQAVSLPTSFFGCGGQDDFEYKPHMMLPSAWKPEPVESISDQLVVADSCFPGAPDIPMLGICSSNLAANIAPGPVGGPYDRKFSAPNVIRKRHKSLTVPLNGTALGMNTPFVRERSSTLSGLSRLLVESAENISPPEPPQRLRRAKSLKMPLRKRTSRKTAELIENPADSVPREQQLKSENDLYTPKWVRFTGSLKEGFCDKCEHGKWLQLKNSAFWYHQQFTHGISSVTRTYFNPPIERRLVWADQTIGNGQLNVALVVEGTCGVCGEWVTLNKPSREHLVTLSTPQLLVNKTSQEKALSLNPFRVLALFQNDALVVPKLLKAPSQEYFQELQKVLCGAILFSPWFRHAHKCASG